MSDPVWPELVDKLVPFLSKPRTFEELEAWAEAEALVFKGNGGPGNGMRNLLAYMLWNGHIRWSNNIWQLENPTELANDSEK